MENSHGFPNILTFVPLPPTTTGGIEEYAYSVVSELRKKGFKVRVVTSRFKDDANYPQESEGYLYVRCLNLYRRPLPINFLSILKVVRAIWQSDLVHIHMSFPLLESFASIISKLFHRNTIITYHADALIDRNSKKPVKELWYFIVEKVYRTSSARLALYFCDIICTNTMSYAASSFVLKDYLYKTKVVHQGIRKDLYDYFDPSLAYRIRSNYLGGRYRYIVTFIGRLVAYKGLPYLIEAARIINTKMNNEILFIIGGNGPQKDYLIDLVNSNHMKNVSFEGYIEDKDLMNLFAASDLVVSPSISNSESTPISLLCALSVGTPVIGTTIGGTEEAIPNDGKRASIIPAKDSKLLAETIISMLKNSRWQQQQQQETLKAEDRNLHEPRFWSCVADDYIKIIYNVIMRSGNRHLCRCS